MGNVRKYTLRLYPGKHDRLIAALETVQKEGKGRLQAVLVEALEARFFRDTPSEEVTSGKPLPDEAPFESPEAGQAGAKVLAQALMRVMNMPSLSAEALASADPMRNMRRLYAAIPRPEDLHEIDAPLVVEAARLLLEQAAAFYRDHPVAEQPEPIRSFLKRYLQLVQEDEG